MQRFLVWFFAAPEEALRPNAALASEAGELANAIAELFPRPHAPYFEADRARRRLIQLIVAGPIQPPASLREPLSTWPARRILSVLRPDAPEGLLEALRKLSGRWSRTDYAALVELLAAKDSGAKALRHLTQITPARVQAMAVMPAHLRRARILAQTQSVAHAALVARAAKRLVRERGEKALGPAAERLERARTTESMFRMLIEEIGLERLAPPPVPGADWFMPLASVRAIEGAALRFENCLKARIPWMLAGRTAYYEVLGPEPAVVEIVRDITGQWVVGEVRGHANKPISTALWSRVRAHLEAHGARTRTQRPDRLGLALSQLVRW